MALEILIIFALLAASLRNAVVMRYTPLMLMAKIFCHSSSVSVPRGRGPVKYPACHVGV